MFEIVESETYKTWFGGLRDVYVRARIDARVRRLGLGNPGKHRVLTHGIVELKIDIGPGVRLYYTMRRRTLVILLVGGDKSTQRDDIRTAIRIAQDWIEP